MIEAFRLSFKLGITARVNRTLWRFSRVSWIRGLMPPDIYSRSWIKTAALVFAILKEVLSIVLGKLVYLYVMVLLPCLFLKETLGSGASHEGIVLHIFLCLTLMGALTNDLLLAPSEEMFYTVFLLRMDGKKYALSHYFYQLFKAFLGFLLVIGGFLLIIGKLGGPDLTFPLWLSPLLALFVIGAKLTVVALQLLFFRKTGKLFSARDNDGYEKSFGFCLIFLFAAAYGPLFLGYGMPRPVAVGICLFFILTGLLGLGVILRYAPREYRAVLKHLGAGPLIEGGRNVEETLNSAVKEQYLKKISLEEDAVLTDKWRGCAFFHGLFVKRHRKLLSRTAIRLAVILGIAAVIAAVLCYLNKDLAATVRANLPQSLPVFAFVTYLLNRGETMTRIFFFNCDSSMMNYSFYRRPEVILGLFTRRLGTVIGINLIPSLVLALALPGVLYICGGTGNPREYVVIFVTILALSVFFSVHYLVLYYLLQPYTLGLAQKGVAYKIATTLTYMICYFCVVIKGLRESSMLFGILVCAFTAVYIAAALILTYRLAPKTFRLKK